MKRLSYVLALLGLVAALLLVSYFGFGNVLTAVSRVGWPKFGLIIGWQLVLFVILGSAWDMITPSRAIMRRRWLLIWGRMVRDASANCLPFSQVGGFVFGVRAVTLQGMEWHTATASTIVDVTAEFLAQIAFACIGLVILVAARPTLGIGGAGGGWPRPGGRWLLRVRLAATRRRTAVRAYRPAASPAEGSPTPASGSRCCRPNSP